MTYRQLIESFNLLPDASLDQDITIKDMESNEYFKVTHWIMSGPYDDAPFDDGQMILCFGEE